MGHLEKLFAGIAAEVESIIPARPSTEAAHAPTPEPLAPPEAANRERALALAAWLASARNASYQAAHAQGFLDAANQRAAFDAWWSARSARALR